VQRADAATLELERIRTKRTFKPGRHSAEFDRLIQLLEKIPDQDDREGALAIVNALFHRTFVAPRAEPQRHPVPAPPQAPPAPAPDLQLQSVISSLRAQLGAVTRRNGELETENKSLTSEATHQKRLVSSLKHDRNRKKFQYGTPRVLNVPQPVQQAPQRRARTEAPVEAAAATPVEGTIVLKCPYLVKGKHCVLRSGSVAAIAHIQCFSSACHPTLCNSTNKMWFCQNEPKKWERARNFESSSFRNFPKIRKKSSFATQCDLH
jgi:hypothetical protein